MIESLHKTELKRPIQTQHKLYCDTKKSICKLIQINVVGMESTPCYHWEDDTADAH